MPFLKFFRDQQQAASSTPPAIEPTPEESQLDFFGQATDVTQSGKKKKKGAIQPQQNTRVDRAKVQQDLQAEVQNRGGGEETYRAVNSVTVYNTFGCGPRELYKETGGKFPDRDTLPEIAQKALLHADLRSTWDLQSSEAEGHDEIVEVVDRSTKESRQVLPWWKRLGG